MSFSFSRFLMRSIKAIIVAFTMMMVVLAASWVIGKFMIRHTTLSINGRIFQMEIADSDGLRKKGLSDRSSIGGNSAMLLVFDETGNHEIWMKGMKFPIDVIWLNEDRRIVHIERQLQPDKQPHKTYKSDTPDRYIIELAAGSVDSLNLKIGSRVEFDI